MRRFLNHPISPLLFCGFILMSFGACSALHQGPPTDHFDGRHFYNAEPEGHTFGTMLKWLWLMETKEWPEWVIDPPEPKPVSAMPEGSLRVTYINHATVLIQMDHLNILTDPIWSKRAGPFSWLGSKRVRLSGIALKDLPKIDMVLISHDHYDHLDLPTLKKLDEKDQPLILTGLGNGAFLKSKGLKNVIEMDWWQEQRLPFGNIKCTFVPARHGSGRAVFQSNNTLWGGFVLEGPAGRVYFAGDTAYGRFLEQIRERFEGFRLTIFPIGNYEKRWFMQNQHMNPEDAVRAHLLLHSQQSLGMHFATFKEHPEQTIDAHEKDLAAALDVYRLPASAFWVLKFGEARNVSLNEITR